MNLFYFYYTYTMAILSINIINYWISSYFFSFKNNIHIKQSLCLLNMD